MRLISLCFITSCYFCLQTQRGDADPYPAQQVKHGERAYQDALKFARQNNVPFFTMPFKGQNRIVVNVPSRNMDAWKQVFSEENGYFEPFFSASNQHQPGWSFLRIGNTCYKKYGQGKPYTNITQTSSLRTAFPLHLSRAQFEQTKRKILTGHNAPFRSRGGDPERAGRNCTNWLTWKIGPYTGIQTGSVRLHMRSLVNGMCSPRMTVMAILSDQALNNFGQEQCQLNW